MGDGDHISPWQPEQNRLRLAVLGKLIEECNELSARAARCIIHGLDEIDPDTGKANRDELEREAADVEACLEIAKNRLALAVDPIRVLRKANGFSLWHAMIEVAHE